MLTESSYLHLVKKNIILFWNALGNKLLMIMIVNVYLTF